MQVVLITAKRKVADRAENLMVIDYRYILANMNTLIFFLKTSMKAMQRIWYGYYEYPAPHLLCLY